MVNGRYALVSLLAVYYVLTHSAAALIVSASAIISTGPVLIISSICEFCG